MSTESRPAPPPLEGGARYYFGLCWCALAVLLLMLRHRGYENWSFLPVLLGVLGLLTRWAMAPTMVLLATAACLSTRPLFGPAPSEEGFDLTDVVLCAAVLAYVVGHCRLQSVTSHLFPVDRKPVAKPGKFLGILRRRRQTELVRRPRAPGLATVEELKRFVVYLPLWAVLAQALWLLLPSRAGNPGLPPLVWQAMLFAWMLGVAVLGTSALADYWGRSNMPAEEALVLLQDELWKETRGEQRRPNRWLVWARLRRRRKRGGGVP